MILYDSILCCITGIEQLMINVIIMIIINIMIITIYI